MVELILTVLLAFPVPWVERGAETPEQRADRFRPAAELMSAYSLEEVAAASAILWHESRGALYVWHSCEWIPEGATGRCAGGRAKTGFQLEISACPDVFGEPDGSERQLAIAVDCAMGLLRYWREECGSVEGMFSGYATGNRCDWKGGERDGAKARAETYSKVLRELKRGKRALE